MNDHRLKNILVDTRPYPEVGSKSELLFYARELMTSDSKAQKKLSEETLKNSIKTMLHQNQVLNFSVALSLSDSVDQYRLLWKIFNQTLIAEQESEHQILVWPLVLVIGANKKEVFPSGLPIDKIKDLFSKSESFQEGSSLRWHNHLISSEYFSTIKPLKWFQAKEDTDSLNQLFHNLTQDPIQIETGQSVQLVFALSYGSQKTSSLIQENLGNLALPLMQIWSEYFSTLQATIFVNPLKPMVASDAMVQGSLIQKRMQLDLFVANNIRSIRLNQQEVAVVIASREGGIIEILLHSLEDANQHALFRWPLNPSEDIDEIVHNLLDLLVECRVQEVLILNNPLLDGEKTPWWQDAQQQNCFNPLQHNEKD